MHVRPKLFIISIYGGGGFFPIQTCADMIEPLEALFEYGLVVGFAFGQVTGPERIGAGIYIHPSRRPASFTREQSVGHPMAALIAVPGARLCGEPGAAAGQFAGGGAGASGGLWRGGCKREIAAALKELGIFTALQCGA